MAGDSMASLPEHCGHIRYETIDNASETANAQCPPALSEST